MPLRSRYLGLFLACLCLAACKGVLELRIDRLPSAQPAPLGMLAYITGGDVWLMDLDSGETDRLTRDGRNTRPLVSRNGSWVAYQKPEGLYASPARGGEVLVTAAGVREYAWSPAGDSLAFLADGLWVWEAGEASRARLLADMPLAARLGWDRAGSGLLVDCQAGDLREVGWIPVDGPPKPWESVYRSPDLMHVARVSGWSPDGNWLLLWSGSVHPEAEWDGLPLCFLADKGGELACLEQRALLWPGYVAWSGEGLVAAVTGHGRETWVEKGLALIDPDDFSLRWLVSPADQAPALPSWSPDSRSIAYSAGPVTPVNLASARRASALEARRIWAVDISSGRRVQLTGQTGFRDERPLWSADGSRILFARIGGGVTSLWIMNSDGSGLRQVVGELTPQPDPGGELGTGYIDWGALWDWQRPEP